jgi:transcriptional regulator GlxA family with amidase domain
VLRDVVCLVHDGVGVFGLGVASEVFGCDRSADGLPAYSFDLVTEHPGPVRSEAGFAVHVAHGLARAATADLVVVSCWDADATPSPAVKAVLRTAVERGARVMSHCSGAFLLAAAGLLDGRRATTHWMYAERLAREFPRVHVDRDVLYVDEGQVLTSAGTAAGIDLSLHLLRCEHGATVANEIARRMVVPPHRDGGQAQYVASPVPAEHDGRLGEVLGWARDHLAEPLTVELLSARALMSPRTFARRFTDTTGTTPATWVLEARLACAEELLESTDLPVETVAARAGFGSATTMREHFARRKGVSPAAYRRSWQRVGAALS